MVKAVLFDMDGTLIDTEKYYRIFWPMALKQFGYDMTDEPGRKAAAELMRKYYELGYEVEDCPPPAGYKDYNEWLVAAKLNLNQMNQRADEPVRA